MPPIALRASRKDEGFARAVALQVAGDADAGQARADNDDVKVRVVGLLFKRREVRSRARDRCIRRSTVQRPFAVARNDSLCGLLRHVGDLPSQRLFATHDGPVLIF